MTNEQSSTSSLTGQERFDGQRTVQLPSGDAMPALGFGTWELDDEAAQQMVGAALDIGIRHIDTAQMYENEGAVGSAIAESDVPREDIFLTTKLGNDKHEPEALMASLHTSLERLQTDHVDLLLVHWPVEFERIGATCATLARAQAEGLTSHIGVSNFTVEQLDQIADLAPIEVLQVECHPFLRQTELRSWCAERGWAFTAYSPLARGEVFGNDVLEEIAETKGVSSGAIALAWLLAQPQVTTIPKTSDVDHLRDNMAALDVELDQEELDRIDSLDAGRRLVDPPFAPW